MKHLDIPPVSVFITQSNSKTLLETSVSLSLLIVFSLTMFWFFKEVFLIYLEILYFISWCPRYLRQTEHCSFFFFYALNVQFSSEWHELNWTEHSYTLSPRQQEKGRRAEKVSKEMIIKNLSNLTKKKHKRNQKKPTDSRRSKLQRG